MCQFGRSAVYVVFEDDVYLYWARSRVLEYLNGVRDRLPEGAMPMLGPDATGVGWVMQYIVADTTGALNLAEPGSGYRRGLRTGANLVTINMTPSAFRDDYLLYKRDRFIMTEEVILRAIEAEGLEPSTLGLAQYYQGRKAQLAVA